MRFFFDENFSPKLVRGLSSIASHEQDEAVPLRDKFPNGISDEEYVEALSSEGNWVIATMDGHIANKPHIVNAWKAAGLIALMFRNSWSRLEFWTLAWRLLKAWPDLRAMTYDARPGSIVRVPITGRPRYV